MISGSRSEGHGKARQGKISEKTHEMCLSTIFWGLGKEKHFSISSLSLMPDWLRNLQDSVHNENARPLVLVRPEEELDSVSSSLFVPP